MVKELIGGIMGRAAKREETRELVARYGEPFARALAVFVNSLDENGLGTLRGVTRLSGEHTLQAWLAQAIAENEAAEKAGTLEEFEFTGNSPQESIRDRIRQIMKQRGMKQTDLAARLKVSPAVITRILKNPRRSRLDTLSRIARALDVEVGKLV
jgi:DNA-binding Xre family transcriptional regulator